MTEIAVPRTGTGGPSGSDHDKLVEHAIGWVLAIVMAMLTVQIGLF
ncbi:SCO1431 family membrane protein [Streptomyces botrytidirepellens]|uniref:SCO1431 family membrane protein n=1 Tax=Streptomyces botrytidirepellens TaxID=2486417 RepID=A0A3M8WA80_9ACTN|nr:SCO1431 family membrane protein [Streptomyces botrytidirepellens]RNG27018.1 SCO1431 family membrane protein [Streptomyces botrytidirepellens]